ncbi:MAG: glycosyltransferase family 2 protein [Anaerolineae bacterium]|nr:glycosyltransferase family 2 protein [Anaerolineae bacterium]
MRSLLIIPALNEAGAIGGVVRAIPIGLVDRVVVVDNGSTDGTAEAARLSGAEVVAQPRRGYGYACYAGVQATDDADIVAFMDGDGSFDPTELPRVLTPLRQGQADLVLGSRTLGAQGGQAVLPHARFGNWLTTALMQSLYGVRVTDLGPMRAIRRDLLLRLDMREMMYGWPTEMMVKAARAQARIVEVPVSYRARVAGESKVSGTLRGSLRAGYQILRTTFRYAL